MKEYTTQKGDGKLFVNYKLGILTFPNPNDTPAGVTALQNFIDIISALTSDLYLITGGSGREKLDITFNDDKCKCVFINYIPKKFFLCKIINGIISQFRYTYQVIKYSKSVSCWLFFFGERGPLLPLIMTKILKNNSILILCASSKNILNYRRNSLATLAIALEKYCSYFSDIIIVYSKNLIKEWNLEKHKNKIFIAPEHFIDFNLFKVQHLLRKRNNHIGYIGRLSGEKGILNLIEAIGLLNNNSKNNFYVIGDGELKEEVKKLINQENLNEEIKLLGWVPHEELPQYLNEMKLLVIPSYTEGLVNVMLEAMACGTPVLATAVGAIPDVIKDGKTGFILEDNSPECIAKNILRALSHPNLEQIAANARALMEQEFTYEAAVERYRKILASPS